MGIGTRQICVKLGERYQLAKPMSMVTLYWHFRNQLVPSKRGRKKKPGRRLTKPMIRRANVEKTVISEMQKMIEQIGGRIELRRGRKPRNE
jgi:hypothetical protein